MYQRFSKQAESVVKSANRFAREYELDYVGTEHVLLAICDEQEGLGGQILTEMEINQYKLKAEVDRLIQKSLNDTWVFGRLPGTPHYRNVVALAIEEADQLGSSQVGTGHLLLALLKEDGSVAQKALQALGCNYDKARESLLSKESEDNA